MGHEPDCIRFLAATVELPAVFPRDEQAGTLRFRIEVFWERDDRYSCNLWRYDTYRIAPTFQGGRKRRIAYDAIFLVLDEAIDWPGLISDSILGVVNAVVDKLELQLGVKIERPTVVPLRT